MPVWPYLGLHSLKVKTSPGLQLHSPEGTSNTRSAASIGVYIGQGFSLQLGGFFIMSTT